MRTLTFLFIATLSLSAMAADDSGKVSRPGFCRRLIQHIFATDKPYMEPRSNLVGISEAAQRMHNAIFSSMDDVEDAGVGGDDTSSAAEKFKYKVVATGIGATGRNSSIGVQVETDEGKNTAVITVDSVATGQSLRKKATIGHLQLDGMPTDVNAFFDVDGKPYLITVSNTLLMSTSAQSGMSRIERMLIPALKKEVDRVKQTPKTRVFGLIHVDPNPHFIQIWSAKGANLEKTEILESLLTIEMVEPISAVSEAIVMKNGSSYVLAFAPESQTVHFIKLSKLIQQVKIESKTINVHQKTQIGLKDSTEISFKVDRDRGLLYIFEKGNPEPLTVLPSEVLQSPN